MRKSKILATAVCAALVTSVAATAAISANAAGIGKVDDIKSHSVGVTGSFNAWAADVPMTDDDGDGVFEGVVDIENVTDDMVGEATKDDGTGTQVPRGVKGITFKVRLDGSWDDSWGDYEPDYERTWNSQTNCVVEAKAGTHVKITVKLDTTKNSPDAVSAGAIDADADVDYTLIPVTYSVEEVAAPAASTPAASTPAASTPAASSPAGTATTTASPATGDATSAVALVAVVLASLGTAVVMTKKASKE